MRNLIAASFVAAIAALPATAQTIERIQKNNELNIGIRKDAAPLSYYDENGNPAGYAPVLCADVAQIIVNALNANDLIVNFVPVDTENRFEMVASGEIDMMCGAATITLTRREIVDFSDPIYVDGAALMMPNDGGTGIKDFADKTIGVRANTTTEKTLKDTLAGLGVEARIESFADHMSARDALKEGYLDAYFADQSILVFLMLTGQMGADFSISQELFTIEKQGIALPRGDSEFRLLVDSALSQLFATGRFTEVFAETLPGLTPGDGMMALYTIGPTYR